MSHAGSTRQAANLALGQIADIVSLASSHDLDHILAQRGCIAADWRQDFPFGSSPFFSTVAIVARPGNPKGISNWSDLLRSDVTVALPNPSRSGIGRWALLGFYADRLKADAGEETARSDLRSLLLRCEIIDLGGRQSLLRFANNKSSDAVLAWESDVLRLEEMGLGHLSPIFLQTSIRIEPRIAIIACHADKRGTAAAAMAYLNFHYSKRGQLIAAQHGLRPSLPSSEAAQLTGFPDTRLLTLAEAFPETPDIWLSLFGDTGMVPRILDLRFARGGGRE